MVCSMQSLLPIVPPRSALLRNSANFEMVVVSTPVTQCLGGNFLHEQPLHACNRAIRGTTLMGKPALRITKEPMVLRQQSESTPYISGKALMQTHGVCSSFVRPLLLAEDLRPSMNYSLPLIVHRPLLDQSPIST